MKNWVKGKNQLPFGSATEKNEIKCKFEKIFKDFCFFNMLNGLNFQYDITNLKITQWIIIKVKWLLKIKTQSPC